MTFPDCTGNEVKAPRMHLLTSVDFVSPQVKTSVRSTASRNYLNLFFFLLGLWKGSIFWQILSIRNWFIRSFFFFCIVENVFYNFVIKKPFSGDTFISFPFSNYTLVQCYFLHCDQVFHCWLFLLVLKLYIQRNKTSFQPFHLTRKS